MLILLCTTAWSAEPPLLPLTRSPVVAAAPVSAAAFGGVTADGETALAGTATLGANVAERATFEVVAGLRTEQAPVLGGAAFVQLLRQEDAQVDLAAGVKYKHEGWDGELGEVEGTLAAGRAFGRTTGLVNAVVGRGLDRPEGDAELALAAIVGVSERVGLGVDSRARVGFAGEEEAAFASEEGEDAWDVVAGPVATADFGAVAGTLAAGGTVVGLRDGGARAGVVAQAGVRVGF